MVLWIALSLMVLSWFLVPIVGRLQGTGLWLGRALAPAEMEPVQPRGLQDALTHGWPSLLGAGSGLLPFVAAGFGFGHTWWMAIVVFFGSSVGRAIVERTTVIPWSVDWYIQLLANHMGRRMADYRKKGDVDRAQAAEELFEETMQVLEQYLGAGVPAPDVPLAQQSPMGDSEFLLRAWSTRG